MESDNTTASTEVPAFNWKALDGADWSVIPEFALFLFGLYMFGMMIGAMGLFMALWLGFSIVMLMHFGIGALFVNPGYILGLALFAATIAYICLKGFGAVATFPTKLYRHFTR